jgi:tartrate dehydratase alpha subunit/fumarate hydratase class I-like protein
MTTKDARAYLKRWRIFNKFREQELRRTSPQVKLRQMDECYRIGVGLGLIGKVTAAKRKSEKAVLSRWRRLKGLPS